MKKVIFMFAVILFLYSQLLIAENNPVPDYDFYTYPTAIMTSYYDYMPGGFKNYPIAPQTEYGDGAYLTFMAEDGASRTKKIYLAFLNEDGTVNGYEPFVWHPNSRSGYSDIEIHPATGDFILTWHESPVSEYLCAITWGDSISNNPPILPPPGYINSTFPDEYMWPQIHKGPSPLGDDWVRYYHVSYNASNDDYGNLCEDLRILYIDIENTVDANLYQLLCQSNWTAVYPLYSWRDVSCCPFASFAVDYVNPGHVAIIGTASWLQGNVANMPVDEGAFVWESFDYGESWLNEDLHSDGPGYQLYEVYNLPKFELPNGDIPDKLMVWAGGRSSNAIIDSEGNVHFPYLQGYTVKDSQGYLHYPKEFFTQAEFVWDGDEFIFRNVPAFPWMDTGGSGHDVPWGIDPTTGDTLYQYTIAYYLEDDLFQSFQSLLRSRQMQSFSLDHEWMIQMWTDCTYHFFALNGFPGYDEYLNHPLLAISASNDNGETWSEPLYLTDVHNPNYNFADQITVYPYIQKIIQNVDIYNGKFVIMYMDDNDFGSYVLGHGPCSGGQINECIVQMDFSLLGINPEPETHIICENYPNPFRISTRISFSSKDVISEDAEVVIYNTKGQFVRTLSLNNETPQSGYANWDSKDHAGKNVANGIYFYKLTGSTNSPTGKMLLTR